MRRLFAVLSVAIWLMQAHAETFRNPYRIPTPVDPTSVNVGDLNGDGRPDIIWLDNTAAPYVVHVLLAQPGSGYLAAAGITLPVNASPACQLFDTNHDGHLDLVCTQNQVQSSDVAAVVVFPGKGDGTFAAPITTTLPSISGMLVQSSVIAGPFDLNSDGVPDIIVVNLATGASYVLLGRGDGTFTVKPNANIYSVNAVAADVNGDGKPDLLFSEGPSVMLGNGDGTFQPYKNYSQPFDYTNRCVFHDMDGDGHLDAVCGYVEVTDNIDIDGATDLIVLHGNPDGSFNPTPISDKTFGNHENEYDGEGSFLRPLWVTDINGDGTPDVIALGNDGLTILLGGPSLTFSSPQHYAVGTLVSAYVNLSEFIDLNGDGVLDVIACGTNGLYISYGRPDGSFTAAPAIEVAGNLGYATVADFNGDGIPDIIATGDVALKLSLGKGDGYFQSPAALPSGAADFSTPLDSTNAQIVHGDFNGDGKQDIIAIGSTSIYQYFTLLLSGHGDGTFDTPAKVLYDTSITYPMYLHMAVADINRDGRDDLVTADLGPGSPQNIYAALSNGDGTFRTVTSSLPYETQVSNPTFSSPFAFPAIADLNGDGKLDAVTAGTLNAYVLLGRGDGSFAPASATLAIPPQSAPYSNGPASAIVTGDFDHDGHKDIAVLMPVNIIGTFGYLSPGGSSVYIYYGRGDGTFTPSISAGRFTHTYSAINTADFDGDGNDDLVLNSTGTLDGGIGIGIIHGRSDRTFGAEINYVAGIGLSSTAIADFNRDGLPDLLFANNDYNIHGSSVTILLSLGNTPTLDPTLTFNPEPSVAGSQFTATAHFAPHTGTQAPIGTAAFTLDGASPQLQLLSANGTAVVTYTESVAGPHTVSVSFPGDTLYAAASASAIHIVTAAPSTTALLSSINPSTLNQPVTFTATLTSTNGTPTGNVQFTDGATSLGTPRTLDVSGVATFTTGTLIVGDHTITATYIPTGSFAASSASLTQTVQAGIPTTTTLISSKNPSNRGDAVTFTAHVASANGTPTGTVTFTEGTTNYGTQTLFGSGDANLVLSGLFVGDHTITITYNPTGTFAGSSASITQTVNGLPDTITLTASPTTGTVHTTSIVLTAIVTPVQPGDGPLTGSVIFSSNGSPIGTAIITNGVAMFSATTLPVGADNITATYLGDTTYVQATSNTVPVTITAAPTNLTLITPVAPQPALFPFNLDARLFLASGPQAGAGYAVTITVAPQTPGASPATTATLTTDASGTIALPISLLPGQYLVSATFAGTSDLQPSTATSVTTTVIVNPTATLLTATPNPGTQNNPVTFTATISALTGTTSPGGTVAILESIAGGTSTLANLTLPPSTSNASLKATVTFSTTYLMPGTHTITAVFTPAAAFGPSQSSTLSVVIIAQGFTLTLSDPTLTVQTGHHRALTVSLTSIGGLTATFAHSCGALPIYVSCLWGQPTVMLPANGTVATSLVIDTNQLPGFIASNSLTTAPVAPFMARILRHGWAATAAFTLIPFSLLSFKRRRNLRSLLSLLVFATLAIVLTACGADKYPASTPPGTYIIPVTATATASGHIYTQTVNLTLVVTP